MSARPRSPSMDPAEQAVATEPAGRARTGTRRRRRAVLVRSAQLLLAVVLLAVWEAGASTGLIDPFFFSQPSAIAQQVIDWIVEGSIFQHLRVPLAEAL